MKHTYFNNLNYTFGNEDTTLEYEILPESSKHTVAIAGSGSRILPLLAKNPELVTCVDTSIQQLQLAELKIGSLRALAYKEFMAFWGYPPHQITPGERKKLFQKIQLSAATHTSINRLLEENRWETVLYAGRWEKTLARLSQLTKLFTGDKGAKLFNQTVSAEYFSYLEKEFPQKAWTLAVKLFGNATVFNTLLYKGHFPVKNIPERLPDFYLRTFNRLFRQGPARNNFLLQLLFFGKLVYPEGRPIECDPEIFSLAQAGLRKATVVYAHDDIVNLISQSNKAIDFVSFSDVPSYYQGDIESTFLQKIYHGLSRNCLLVIRNYLRVPENLNVHGYENITPQFKQVIDREKVQMYIINILRKQ